MVRHVQNKTGSEDFQGGGPDHSLEPGRIISEHVGLVTVGENSSICMVVPWCLPGENLFPLSQMETGKGRGHITQRGRFFVFLFIGARAMPRSRATHWRALMKPLVC